MKKNGNKRPNSSGRHRTAAHASELRQPASEDAALVALRAESERALVEQIRRLLSLPMNKRTHFLRVRHPGGGSHL